MKFTIAFIVLLLLVSTYSMRISTHEKLETDCELESARKLQTGEALDIDTGNFALPITFMKRE